MLDVKMTYQFAGHEIANVSSNHHLLNRRRSFCHLANTLKHTPNKQTAARSALSQQQLGFLCYLALSLCGNNIQGAAKKSNPLSYFAIFKQPLRIF